MRLIFDIQNLKGSVTSAIQNCSRSLDSAYNTLSSISVPSDFPSGSNIRTLARNVSNTKINATNFKNYLNGAINKLEGAERQNTNLAQNGIGSLVSRVNLSASLKTAIRQYSVSASEKLESVLGKYNMNDNLKQRVVNQLMELNANEEIELESMNEETLDITIINTIGKVATTNEFFEYFSEASEKYGVDQGLFYNLKDLTTVKNTQEYLKTKYNMDLRNSAMLLSALDSIGACSYADFANNIVAEFKDIPEKFKETFGFDLYEKTDRGWKINDAKLLADMFMYINMEENGGQIVTKDAQGNYIVNTDKIEMTGSETAKLKDGTIQQYMSNSSEMNTTLMNKYLTSKTNDNISVNVNDLGASWNGHEQDSDGVWKLKTKQLSDNEISDIASKVKNAMVEGKQVSLGIYTKTIDQSKVIFTQVPTKEHNDAYVVDTGTWDEGDGHAVKITDVTDEGFIVTTWGRKMIMPFNDLKNYAAFHIFAVDINNNTE